MKQKEAIKKVAFGEHRNVFQIFPARKYINIFTELLKVFTASCGKSHRVDFNWLWLKARNVYQDQEFQGAVVKKHVLKSFIKRHHLKYFRAQWNKKKSKEAFRVKLVKWHETLCERLVCTGGKESCYEEKWGYYKPYQRLNVYQSPLPFAIECKKTAGERFCSLNTWFIPDGTQPRIAVIFRSKGKRISVGEKEACYLDIDVYF